MTARLLSLAVLATTTAVAAGDEAVEFNRHVRPILAEYCFACHGPDPAARKAKLRLDTREGAFAELNNGGFAVVPGKPTESAILERVAHADPKKVMPPPKTGKKPTSEQIATLKRWIERGAAWSDHWAFVGPRRPAAPKVANSAWVRSPVDAFVLARLDAAGLAPNPEADARALVRRATLDLTGLPPTPAEVEAFVAAVSAKPQAAYGEMVDRLLASPRYAEHMTRSWLDAARYGDTHGLHLDNYREIWPYRDWVIRAFDRNLPYDRFVVEQLAGDLLPNPTAEQIVATGYNRCHVSTAEGGSIDEEVYVRNVVDQVDTNGNVFLGLSVGCARCHDHKFDPITQKDYYSLFAFFNSIDGNAQDGNAKAWAPVVTVPTPEQARRTAELKTKLDGVRDRIAKAAAKLVYAEPKDAGPALPTKPTDFVWIDDAAPAGSIPVGGTNVAWSFVTGPIRPVKRGTKSLHLSADGLRQVVLEGANPPLQIGAGDKLFAYVWLDPKNPPKEVMLQWHSTGWLHRAYWGGNLIDWGRDNSPERRPQGKLPEVGTWVRLEVPAASVGLKPGATVTGFAMTQFGGTAYWDAAGIVTKTPQGPQSFESLSAWVAVQKAANGAGLPANVQEIVKMEPAKHSDAHKATLREHFLVHVYPKTKDQFATDRKELADLDGQRTALEGQIPTTLVFRERKEPRPAFLLKRGEYDQRGDKVDRATPGFLPTMPASLPKNRLGFAQWLVSPDHPLTARVFVNRLWQQLFGVGLVKTSEDFGTQGEPPSHPELLDWLAVEFREGGWDVKKLVRTLVHSAAYRQSSRTTPEKLARDPANRFVSRGPRFRLDAEVLRDQALFASGLMVEKVGGPGVKPPQPSGIWEAVGYVSSNTARFAPDAGPDKVHRRSLYTFWKRTAPPPQMTVTDAPSREACTCRRERTNTPLQALLLLNETQYVECARALAERAMKAAKSDEERVATLFERATARRPDATEMAELLALYRDEVARFATNVDAAKKLIAVGETKPDGALAPAELAAWTMVANVVLNLDEVITKG